MNSERASQRESVGAFWVVHFVTIFGAKCVRFVYKISHINMYTPHCLMIDWRALSSGLACPCPFPSTSTGDVVVVVVAICPHAGGSAAHRRGVIIYRISCFHRPQTHSRTYIYDCARHSGHTAPESLSVTVIIVPTLHACARSCTSAGAELLHVRAHQRIVRLC